MDDWRLRGQEDHLQDAVLRKVVFPEFWEAAYAQKNEFYQKIHSDAHRYVETHHRGEEYLEGDKIRHFWHEHCEFCWEKALTDEPGEFYCTRDFSYWICENCFHDFREKFNWAAKG